ncbi:unnamed protein product [Soboliphyme baturini]|uniref:Bromo domain-containing protein n=1 Tax=Soboliphyme baturini TaxID=241478 RepID=A0A183I9H9_9BILA|nr:unnamed protein product [Soboliphyme baturini]
MLLLSLSFKVNFDYEEKEREELQRILRGENDSNAESKLTKLRRVNSHASDKDGEESDGRKLKIYRTYRNANGTEHVTVEYVTKIQLIEAYVKIRTKKDEAFIRHFAQMDEQYREERRREKRRLQLMLFQDQLRRIRKNEMKAKMGFPVGSRLKLDRAGKPPAPPKPSLLKMRCSACGRTGHMKTNKHCPLYGRVKVPPQQVAPTDEQIEEELQLPSTSENLVSVEGTKVKLSKVVVEHAEKMKKKALKLKFPKLMVQNPAKLSTFSKYKEMIDGSRRTDRSKISSPPFTLGSSLGRTKYYDEGVKQSVHRRRADPKVTMSVVLEKILNELKGLPQARNFLLPVNKKSVPDYYKIVKKPMDLQQIRMNLCRNHYVTREEFLKDVRQILDNSRLYNGDQSYITQAARDIFEYASRRIAEKEHKIMKLERAINPLLDDNDQVAFSFILERIVDSCKKIPRSFAFHQPVDRKKVKTYYEKVTRPMDLGTMEHKCKRHMYHSVVEFIRDAEQIYINSEKFNGPSSSFTQKASEIVALAKKLIAEVKVLLNVK